MFYAGVTELHTLTLERLPRPRLALHDSSQRVGGPLRGEHLDADTHAVVVTHKGDPDAATAGQVPLHTARRRGSDNSAHFAGSDGPQNVREPHKTVADGVLRIIDDRGQIFNAF